MLVPEVFTTTTQALGDNGEAKLQLDPLAVIFTVGAVMALLVGLEVQSRFCTLGMIKARLVNEPELREATPSGWSHSQSSHWRSNHHS